MSQRTANIGGKEIQLSEPYSPDESLMGEQIGREGIMELITAAWMGSKNSLPLSPLLVGDPGVGKNRLVYQLAKDRGEQPLYIFQGHEDVTAEDLACAVRFSDDKNRTVDYIASPLASAMHIGGICFIDEIAKIRPRALALLVSVLDERRYIDSNLIGGRIKAHKGFRFIAATNTADLVGNSLPEFIRSRMRPVISVGYQERIEIDEIIKDRYFNILKDQMESLLNIFWIKWSELKKDKFKPPTPRDVIYLFNLATSLADLLGHEKVEEKDLERAFNEIYRDNVNEDNE